jgi:hypothetical protein
MGRTRMEEELKKKKEGELRKKIILGFLLCMLFVTPITLILLLIWFYNP